MSDSIDQKVQNEVETAIKLMTVIREKLLNGSDSLDYINELERLLGFYDLENFDLDMKQNYLGKFLTTAAINRNSVGAKILIDTWEKFNLDEDVPQITKILLIPAIEEYVVVFVLNLYPNIGFSDHIRSLIQLDASSDVYIACTKLTNVYPHISFEEVSALLAEIQIQEEEHMLFNFEVRRYLNERHRELSPRAPVPDWIIKTEPEVPTEQTELGLTETGLPDIVLGEDGEIKYCQLTMGTGKPSHSELLANLTDAKYIADGRFRLPSDQRALKLILKDYTFENMTPEEIRAFKKSIAKKYRAATTEQKKELLKTYYLDQASRKTISDQDYFRILGPTNLIPYNDFSRWERCSAYGGCRMFTCIEQHNSDDFGEEIVEDALNLDHKYDLLWFTGNCQVCNYLIDNPCYALRRPLVTGTWYGCYCSFKCLLQDIPEDDEPSLAMVNSLNSALHEIGIADREWSI